MYTVNSILEDHNMRFLKNEEFWILYLKNEMGEILQDGIFTTEPIVVF